MEKARVNIDPPALNKALQDYVRSRAHLHGSFIVYRENGQIVQEDPRTGIKTIIPDSQKK